MYEKTIAGEHRSFQITITSTPTTVYDLLTTGDKAIYDALLTTGTVVEPLAYASQNLNTTPRIPIDGYVISSVGSFKVRLDATGIDETISMSSYYPSPVYFWPHKTWLSATGNTVAIVRIFFS